MKFKHQATLSDITYSLHVSEEGDCSLSLRLGTQITQAGLVSMAFAVTKFASLKQIYVCTCRQQVLTLVI
jgi:hypothetical protein